MLEMLCEFWDGEHALQVRKRGPLIELWKSIDEEDYRLTFLLHFHEARELADVLLRATQNETSSPKPQEQSQDMSSSDDRRAGDPQSEMTFLLAFLADNAEPAMVLELPNILVDALMEGKTYRVLHSAVPGKPDQLLCRLPHHLCAKPGTRQG